MSGKFGDLRAWLAGAAVGLSLIAPHAGAASAAKMQYRLPYDVEVLRNRNHKPVKPSSCPSATPGPRDLTFDGFYRKDDPTHSKIDPARKAAYDAAIMAVRTFERTVSDFAGRALRSVPGDDDAARCVIILLDGWAASGAMLGTVSAQGGYERKWSAITYALAFAETRATANDEQALRIADWLRAIGREVMRHYDRAPSGPLSDRANNHAYWAALSGAAVGVAAGDEALFAWAMARFGRALDDIDPDGFLPLELKRGSRALHYHRFSLEPLLLLALTARANSVKIAPERLAALDRLRRRVQTGLDNPAPFAERSGHKQEPAGKSKGDWAWAELALALRPDATLESRIAPLRPLAVRWLGGDLTLRYRVP